MHASLECEHSDSASLDYVASGSTGRAGPSSRLTARQQKEATARDASFCWWSLHNESRTVITNHARGVYIIKTEFCISSTQRVVYHQVADECTLKRDDIQPKGLMISTTLRAVMIYQVCDLDKKIPRIKFSVFFGGPSRTRT